jgi:large subunit ribosomal protein L29
MKMKEVLALDIKKLDAKLKELKQELFNLRFQAATNNLENPNRIREVKKDIARVLTYKSKLLVEREAN